MTDESIRIFIYETLVASGHAPTSGEIGAHFGVPASEVRARLAALKVGKTVLVHPRSGEIWMAGPFAASKSAYELTDGATTWWANCAWDMFGVAMIVGRRLVARTACGDCGVEMFVDCDPHQPPPASESVVHFLLPARRWYDDIGLT
jgi:hypothetical protein